MAATSKGFLKIFFNFRL